MSVELQIENIGGLRGKQFFSFRKGKVNIIESPNAAGKTSIIKSLAAALSLPGVTRAATEEMIHLGLKASEIGEIDPLINIYSDSASIKLKVDKEEIISNFHKWKEPTINPKGNERFVFAGFLTRESKVVRYLAEGNDDFMWIVDTMSLAHRYEEARSQIEKSLTEATMHLDEVRKKKRETDQIAVKTQKSEAELSGLKREYDDLGKELKAKPSEDPKLRSLFEAASEKERLKGKEVDELQDEVEKAEQELAKPRMELNSIDRDVKLLQKTRDSVLDEIKKLPQEAAIKKMLAEADEIERQTIPNLREERGEKVGVFNLFDSALQVIEQGKKIACPLCGSSDIDRTKIYQQKEDLKKQVAKLDREIGELLIKADGLRGGTVEIGSKKKEKEKELDKVESELQEKNARKQDLERFVSFPQRRLETKEADLEKARQELLKITEELGKIEHRMKEIEAKSKGLFVRRERLKERISMIDKELQDGKKALHDSSLVIVNELPVPIARAEVFYKRWIDSLEAVGKHLEEASREQRQGAARRFNSEVKNLTAKLGFSEFEQILLNEETYKLQVFRKEGRPQAISSLSGSERNALATLLQLAIKEAYIPEIPFFTVDEVVLDFDRTRVGKIFGYLAEVAEKKDWCVVVTKLGGESAISVKQA
jgi:chromosome segregation ATPase